MIESSDVVVNGVAEHRGDGRHMGDHEHPLTEDEAAAMFEPSGWEERYLGEEKIWSGNPNPQLVTEVSRLTRAPRSTSAAERAAT
jgi:hypothetical protein